VSLDISSFNLHELINDALREVQGLAQQKGISLHTRFDREIGKVEADHEKIFRIVLNLLTNAVKYNAENGEIHVETRQMPQDKVRISVRDTGIGIPPESQSRIFEKFYRVPGTETVAKGTGLGLVIAQRIAQAHGGTMGLKSKVGEGSTFYFIIPISHVAGSITFDDSITISP
jgi:two-component system phosphate regulon sensor histidine kinase PhoR